jgi:hypothetical protein
MVFSSSKQQLKRICGQSEGHLLHGVGEGVPHGESDIVVGLFQ